MFLRYIVLFYLMSCSQPKQMQTSVSDNEKTGVRLPVCIDYSKSVPDSIQEFMKVYLKTKDIAIISMKEAIEMIMNRSTEEVVKKIQSGTISSEKEIQRIVEQTMKQPVCSKINIQLFQNEELSKIDSIKWTIMPMPVVDSTQKTNTFIYYPDARESQNVFIQWRTLANEILNSRLLK